MNDVYGSGLSLRQLEYFLTVVEESSFTRAAELLHVTQPALSHQVKALERSVGGALLERLPRGVRLTAMGRAFLPDAELAVRSAGRARRAARAAAGAEDGELHVATLHPMAAGLLPPVFARWRAAHPGVRLVLREYATAEELADAVGRGVADVAIGYRPADDWPGPLVPLGDEEIVVVLPPDDPLAARASLRLAELQYRGWIRCALEPRLRGEPVLDVLCREAGFTPRTVVHTEHTTTAVRMARAGVGIDVSPSYATAGAPGVPLDPPLRRAVVAYGRVEFTGAAARFVGLLREETPTLRSRPT